MPIEVEQLSYTYTYAQPGAQEAYALRGVSLKIEDGGFAGIMGRTGCGKTTLIQLMAGLLSPSGGRVLLDGADINAKGYDRSLLRRSVGVVFQYPEYQLFETTVEKDVAFALKHSGLGRAEVSERVQWALEVMGFDFDTVRLQSPLALSGGEKRRVAIAGVLAAKPRLLIFDEPVAGLDPRGRRDFLSLVKRLNDSGTTIVMVSHNADALSECAREIFVLDGGRLTLRGPVQEVFAKLSPSGISTAQEISGLLAQRGMVLPRDTLTYDALLSALKSRLNGGEKP